MQCLPIAVQFQDVLFIHTHLYTHTHKYIYVCICIYTASTSTLENVFIQTPLPTDYPEQSLSSPLKQRIPQFGKNCRLRGKVSVLCFCRSWCKMLSVAGKMISQNSLEHSKISAGSELLWKKVSC